MDEVTEDQISEARAALARLTPNALVGRVGEVMQRIKGLIRDGRVTRVAMSAGKDSTATLNITLMAALECQREGLEVPTIYVTSSDTEVESPVVARLLERQHQRINAWAERHGLDVRTHLIRPPLAQGWWVRILTGRKLPSYFDIQKTADCSVSMKVQPQLALSREIDRELVKAGRKPSVAIIGTRFAESAHRAGNMAARGESAFEISEGHDGTYTYHTFSPIADWSDAEVFAYLNVAGIDARLPAYTDSFQDVIEVYAEAASDTCMLVPDPRLSMRRQSGCGRFGCHTCMRVPVDNSLDNLTAGEGRDYMRPLQRMRTFLMNIRWDYSRRYWISRNPNSAAGDTRVMPHCFNLETCELLMRCLLTIDRREALRAERVREQLAAGEIPDIARNRELAEPQFQNLSLDKVVAIDMQWSTDAFARPFHALKIYDEVWNQGIETEVPEVEEAPRPAEAIVPRYVATDVRELWANLGLTDATALTAGQCDSAAYREADRMTIEAESLELMTMIDWEDLLTIHDSESYKPQYAAHYYLRTGVVAYGKRYRRELDYQLRRGAWLHATGLAAGLPPHKQAGVSLIEAEEHDRRFLAGLQRLDATIEGLPDSEPERQKLLKRTLAGARIEKAVTMADYRSAARRHVAATAALEVARAEGWRSFDGQDLEEVVKAAGRERRRIARALDDRLGVFEVDQAVEREARDKALAIQSDETVDLEGFGVWLVLGAAFWDETHAANRRRRADQLSLFDMMVA